MIPIFIIVKDRTSVLQQSIESYQTKIKSPVEIILLDQESTYPGMIDFLKEKESEGIRVEYLKDILPTKRSKFPKIVSSVNAICAAMKVKYYVLTDPDIMFENIDGDILEFYTYFLEKNPGFEAIGPMLEIDDIPDYYPFKDEVFKQHQPFWDATGKLNVIGSKKVIKYNDKSVTYQVSPIDSSFALRHTLLQNEVYTAAAVRTRTPYTAKHLDWYIDPDNMTEDQKYYIETANTHAGISHWGGSWFKYPENLKAFQKKGRRPK
jgi:hypothetical protein